jgi:hypothetical protein
MTSGPLEPGRAAEASADDAPAGDLGIGGPADTAGPAGETGTPSGYPEEVDPTEGPLAGRTESGLGDLRDPGATR